MLDFMHAEKWQGAGPVSPNSKLLFDCQGDEPRCCMGSLCRDALFVHFSGNHGAWLRVGNRDGGSGHS